MSEFREALASGLVLAGTLCLGLSVGLFLGHEYKTSFWVSLWVVGCGVAAALVGAWNVRARDDD